MTNKLLLEMKGITKNFSGVKALDKVDFTLKEGEIHALIGENGAGKSTLMKILIGVLHKDEGHILLNGREILRKPSPKEAQRLGISMIFQEFSLFPHLSVSENIALSSSGSMFISRQEWREKARNILSVLGVSIDENTLVGELTVAEQQVVEIAKALSLNARILIMDEPTSALSREEVEKLFALLRSLKAQGVSIVLISHRIQEIFEIAERVTVLRDGKKVDTRELENVTQDELVKMMVGRDVDVSLIIPETGSKACSEKKIVLEVNKLTGKPFFEDVTFHLYEKEVLGVAGLMGSGRTEVAKAIFGFIPHSQGEIKIEDKLVSISSPKEAIGLGIAYLSEDRKREGLVLGMSVWENITLPILDVLKGGLGLLPKKKEYEIASKYKEELRIRTPNIFKKVKYLSGGNQQKVVLAKWLAANSKILILDEPTRGIDVGAKMEIWHLIRELAKESGKSLIVISSELPEILRVSDRILVMHAGRVMGILTREEASEEKIMWYATGHSSADFAEKEMIS